MKNLTKLTTLVASLLLATSAIAEDKDVTGGKASAELKGHVPLFCSIIGDIAEGGFDFGHNPQQGDMLQGQVWIQCNSAAGFKFVTSSANGGLVNPDAPDHIVCYSAAIGNGGLKACQKEDGYKVPGAQGRDLPVKITLAKTPLFAGYYADTLTMVVAAQ